MCLCVAILRCCVCVLFLCVRVLIQSINAPTCTHYFLNQDSFITVPQVELNPELPECFATAFKSKITELADILSILNYQVTQIVEISTEASSGALHKSLQFWFKPFNLEEKNYVQQLLLDSHSKLRCDWNHSTSVSAQLDCIRQKQDQEKEKEKEKEQKQKQKQKQKQDIDIQNCSLFEIFELLQDVVPLRWLQEKLQSHLTLCDIESDWKIQDLVKLKLPSKSVVGLYQYFVLPGSSMEPLRRLGSLLSGAKKILPKKQMNPCKIIPGQGTASLENFLACFCDIGHLEKTICKNSSKIDEWFKKKKLNGQLIYQSIFETTESLYTNFGS